jgi:hypothetical protein
MAGNKSAKLLVRVITNLHSMVLLHNGGFAMAASQNGFRSFKLSIHKKTNTMQIMTKIFNFYLFNLLS